MKSEDNVPCLLSRIWTCLVLKRKEWWIAMAASTLTGYARNTGNDELYEQMDPLQEKLWNELFKK